jgi:hypothetical protein
VRSGGGRCDQGMCCGVGLGHGHLLHQGLIGRCRGEGIVRWRGLQLLALVKRRARWCGEWYACGAWLVMAMALASSCCYCRCSVCCRHACMGEGHVLLLLCLGPALIVTLLAMAGSLFTRRKSNTVSNAAPVTCGPQQQARGD